MKRRPARPVPDANALAWARAERVFRVSLLLSSVGGGGWIGGFLPHVLGGGLLALGLVLLGWFSWQAAILPGPDSPRTLTETGRRRGKADAASQVTGPGERPAQLRLLSPEVLQRGEAYELELLAPDRNLPAAERISLSVDGLFLETHVADASLHSGGQRYLIRGVWPRQERRDWTGTAATDPEQVTLCAGRAVCRVPAPLAPVPLSPVAPLTREEAVGALLGDWRGRAEAARRVFGLQSGAPVDLTNAEWRAAFPVPLEELSVRAVASDWVDRFLTDDFSWAGVPFVQRGQGGYRVVFWAERGGIREAGWVGDLPTAARFLLLDEYPWLA